jgi:hypothetical protein
MWPLTDTALYLIEEANLISARRNGIDLDLESLWRDLAAPAMVPDGAPSGQAGEARMRIQELDDRLLALLVHAWPRPEDPVVIGLRREAAALLDALRARSA